MGTTALSCVWTADKALLPMTWATRESAQTEAPIRQGAYRVFQMIVV